MFVFSRARPFAVFFDLGLVLFFLGDPPVRSHFEMASYGLSIGPGRVLSLSHCPRNILLATPGGTVFAGAHPFAVTFTLAVLHFCAQYLSLISWAVLLTGACETAS